MRATDVYESPTRVPAGIALALAALGLLGVILRLPGFGVAEALAAAGLVIAVVCLARGLARGVAGLALAVALAAAVGRVVAG